MKSARRGGVLQVTRSPFLSMPLPPHHSLLTATCGPCTRRISQWPGSSAPGWLEVPWAAVPPRTPLELAPEPLLVWQRVEWPSPGLCWVAVRGCGVEGGGTHTMPPQYGQAGRSQPDTVWPVPFVDIYTYESGGSLTAQHLRILGPHPQGHL